MDARLALLIKEYQAKGFDYSRITEELKKKGYKPWDIHEAITTVLGQKVFYRSAPKIKFFRTFIMTFLKPRTLFTEIRDNYPYPMQDWRYLFLLIVFSGILALLGMNFIETADISLQVISTHNVLLSLFLLGYLINFDIAAAGWGWAMFFLTWTGGSFWQHRAIMGRTMTYSLTPVLAFGWVPFINIFTGTYALYLQFIALDVFLGMSALYRRIALRLVCISVEFAVVWSLTKGL